MVQHINVNQIELERLTNDLKQSTADFEDVVNITIDSASVIPQVKQNGNEEYCQVNPQEKIRLIRLLRKWDNKIEQTANNQVEKIVSEENETAKNRIE